MFSCPLFPLVRRALFIACLLLLSNCFAHARINVDPIVENPLASVLSTQQGLTQDTVRDLLIDQDGFLWVATDGGLDRYDGHRVESIQGPDGLLGSTPVETLFLDSRARLWIGTQYRGLFMLDLATNKMKQVFSLANLEIPDFAQSVHKFIELPDGNLLVLLHQSVVQLDVNSFEYTTLYNIDVHKEDRVPWFRDMLLADDLLLLAASNGLHIAKYTGEELEPWLIEHRTGVDHDLDNLNVKRLVLDSQGNLLVGTVSGLYSLPWEQVKHAYRGRSHTAGGGQLLVAKRNIWQFVVQNDSLIWVASDIGLLRLKPADNSWSAEYVLEPAYGDVALSQPDVFTMALTADDNLWLGTAFNGAIFWSPKSLNFEVLQNKSRNSPDNPLSDNVIWSMYEDTDHILWVGSENGLTRYDPATDQSQFYLVQQGIRESYSIHQIVKIMPAPLPDKLVLNTYGGILLFDKITGDYEKMEFGLGEEEALYGFGAAFYDDQKMYFYANHFYLYDFGTQQLTTLTELEEQVSFNTVMTFIGPSPINPDEMLIAAVDGLWAYNIETKQATQLHRLPDRLINTDFWPDKVKLDGHILWVVYPGYGLVGLDAKTYEERHHFGRETFGQAVVMFDLLEDAEGYFWFSSLNGIHRFSSAELNFIRYEYGREIPIAEFNQGANQKLHDGRMAFGSPKGILFFDPLELNRVKKNLSLTDTTRQMVITNIGLASRDLMLPKKNLANTYVELNYDDYGLSIEFSALEYHMSRGAQFKYMLSKGDQILSEGVTPDTKVVLPSLAPGKYRFEVAPSARVGDRTILPASLSISMDYQPFLSPLAYLLYALAVLVLFGAYLTSRNLQLKRLKQAQQQVRLFGNAFQHTSDWVVIFDESHRPVAANPAFEKAFGVSAKENLERQLYRIYQQVPSLETQISGQLKLLSDNDVWKGEERMQMPDGRQYDVLIDINQMSGGKELENTHYLVVISNITEQKNAERKLVKIANFDNLTGLVNRSLLLDRLEHAIASATTHEHTVAVLFVDLDRFKGINDSLGHDYGDKLLRVIANRMLNQASKSDTVARLGGDEFVIVMEEVESESAVSSFVAQLIESIETPISLGKEVLRVSCSVGISFFPNDATDPAELLKQADVAMYTAKRNTLSAFIYYTKEMNERAVERLALENRVKSAYEARAFENFYQPIVNLSEGKTIGVELLLRCHYKDEWISPAAFIPVLEELRHIIELTRLATENAIDDLKRWYAEGFNGYVSINLSALHFKTHFDLEFIVDLLDKADLPRSAIRFEITEGVLIDKSDEVLYELNRIRDAGFKLALDDFGTGYSSLSYLRRFPLDILKIDKSFIDDVKESSGENALVQTTINLALSLKMDCVAEGIEHSEQVQYLINHGCSLMQGFYFSRPVDAQAVTPLLFKQWRTPDVSFFPNI